MTVGLSREELLDKFMEARTIMCQPDAMTGQNLSLNAYQSEELNEAVKLLEVGLMAMLVVINENNKAIAENLKG